MSEQKGVIMSKIEKISKAFIAIALVLAMSFVALSTHAYAAEATSNTIPKVGTSSVAPTSLGKTEGSTNGVVSGYGKFTVTTSGKAGLVYDRIVLTSYDASDDCEIYINVIKPDGNYFKNGFFLNKNTQQTFVMYFAQTGIYTIEYNVITGSSAIKAQINP
jgi:hypothetical protein